MAPQAGVCDGRLKGLSDQGLAYYGNRVVRAPEDPRRRALKRTLAFGLAALVHLGFLILLTISVIQQQKIGARGPIETILNLSMLRNPSTAPPVNLIRPQIQNAAPPEIETAPITITPPKPQEEENKPAAPGDVLKAVGQAVACGASNFENLTDAQRAHCKHPPWIARKLPNGNIVMDVPPKQAAPPQIHMSGSDELHHQLQTGPGGCPILQQAPCVDDIIHGRSAHPF